MQFLQGPAFLDKCDRQPVKEFRMTGRCATETEIVGGRNKAHSEMMLPDPVDQHAGGPWILRGGDPAGEGQAPSRRVSTGRIDFGRIGVQNRHKSCRDFFTRLREIPLIEDVSRRGFGPDIGGPHGVPRRSLLPLDFRDLRRQFFKSWLIFCFFFVE